MRLQYLPPTYNLDKFINGFNGGESKGFFPYEWLDHPDKLDYAFSDLKIEYFNSSLKNTKMKPEDFNWLMKYRKEMGVENCKRFIKMV